jgi:CelD/BcsL family acetyltransferase involved in cellulose biosynthesis
MSRLAAELITDDEAFEALEPSWWALWRRSETATPFQSPAWQLPWWRNFAPGPLRTVALWQEQRLVGLAPFYLEDGAIGRRLLPVGISLSDYLDVLVDAELAEEAGQWMLQQMLATGWDSWEFEELEPGALAMSLAYPASLRDQTTAQSACPVLLLAGDERLAGCVPARKRRQLRRAVARAELLGMTITRVNGNPDRFLDEVFRLHRMRWESRGEPGILEDKRVQRFHQEALPALLAAGLARCYIIEIGGVVAGAYYGFSDRGRAYAYLGGFDPAFSEESPGSILMGHAIAEAMREGAAEFHFLRGQERYKYDWGGVDRWNKRRSLRRVPG